MWRQWRVAAAEAMLNFGDTDLSQQVKVVKTILHPGEVRALTPTSETAYMNQQLLCPLIGPASKQGGEQEICAACVAAQQAMCLCFHEAHSTPTCKGPLCVLSKGLRGLAGREPLCRCTLSITAQG